MPWPEYFMNIAFMVAERSTCLRRKVGAVAVGNKRILATGYNGAPASLPHCAETGCLREELKIPPGQRHEMCRGLHAEQNVIIQAALHGAPIRDAILYCTTHPCVMCTKMLINCSVNAVYYAEDYPDPLAAQLLREAGIRAEMLGVPRSPL
jgi:dCMP deaminase